MSDDPEDKEIYDAFLRLEDHLDLFSVKIRGVHIWERLRFSTYNQIIEEKGSVNQAHYSSDSKFQNLLAMARNAFIKNPFLVHEKDVLFIGHPRRKQRDDGLWWDIYCDPIIDQLNKDYIYAERPYMHEHKKPARTENIRYLDLIDHSVATLMELGLVDTALTQDEKQLLGEIADSFKQEFNIQIDFESKIKKRLTKRRFKKPLYKRFIRRVDPDIVVVVVSYANKTRIEACKELGIPVVELQHGVIHEKHLSYHFPKETDIFTFPDYIFTFGEYWCDCVNYPIDDDKLIPVGYPYLEMQSKKYAGTNKRDQILFISQGNIGYEFSNFALKVQEHPNIDYDIVYKLHPGEYAKWKEEYPWLVDADFEVVDDSDRGLYRLFAESEVQVGVGSTAVYEGLCFDLETYVYDCVGSSVLQPLIDEGTAEPISSVEEFASVLGSGEVVFDREYYFAPNATDRVCDTLEEFVFE